MESIAISKVRPNSENPRYIKDEKFKKLVQSIKEFPEMMPVRPIVVNKEMVVLGGNMRLKAMQEAGLEKVWVEIVDWSEEKQREFIIKDNVGFGEWDWDELANTWDAEELNEWGLDTPDNWGGEELEAEEDDYSVPEELKTDVVLGDLIEIGEHRLLCGDSTDADQVAKLMNGEKAEIVFTDPPYSSGGSQESGKTVGSIGARGGKTIKNDNLSTRGYRLLMQDVLSLQDSAHSIFIFCDWKMWIETFDISERSGFRVRNMLVWDKVQMGMGMPFRNQHELCLFASKIAGKIGNGKTANVIQCQRDRDAIHATPKPIKLISDILLQVDSENVLDPFLGGGSTMVAAHQLKRKCYGMELDPKYCQVIIDRMTKLDPTLSVKINGKEYVKTVS